jgi:hypothetical protein
MGGGAAPTVTTVDAAVVSASAHAGQSNRVAPPRLSLLGTEPCAWAPLTTNTRTNGTATRTALIRR